MSKTGGGRGTNQHKIKGTSQAKKATGTSGESSISLSAPAKDSISAERVAGALAERFGDVPVRRDGVHSTPETDYIGIGEYDGHYPVTVDVHKDRVEIWQHDKGWEDGDLGSRPFHEEQLRDDVSLEDAVDMAVLAWRYHPKHKGTPAEKAGTLAHEITTPTAPALSDSEREHLASDSALRNSWHDEQEEALWYEVGGYLGNAAEAEQEWASVPEREHSNVREMANEHNGHIAASIAFDAPPNATIVEIDADSRKISAYYDRDGNTIEHTPDRKTIGTFAVPNAGIDHFPKDVTCTPELPGGAKSENARFINLNAARDLSDRLMKERRDFGAEVPPARSAETRSLQRRATHRPFRSEEIVESRSVTDSETGERVTVSVEADDDGFYVHEERNGQKVGGDSVWYEDIDDAYDAMDSIAEEAS
ncbi:hypothetical protein [Nesterenkonia rhizosphaerae]|uniref:Uncharacterized protein n=1 Tax=Nesterenkonia rhizosphaerae TaxID=1348272 RepID=A0ABP9FZV7_9MICC